MRSRAPYTGISLFSGCGGLDLGLEWSGIDVKACFEIDPNCCDTLRANITKKGSDTKVYEGDVREVDPNDVMADLGMGEGQLDVLFGGSPCQSFSQIGKQMSLEDDRGLLLFEIPRFAEVMRPKVILMEQVKGLLSAKDKDGIRGGVCKLLEERLEGLGYRVFKQVLLASDYGVSQNRQRVFIVATRCGGDYEFPLPSNGSKGLGLPPHRTVGEVLEGLRPPTVKDDDVAGVPEDSHFDVTPQRDRERIHGVPEGQCLAHQLHLPDWQRGGLTRKDTTKFLRVHRAKPSNTLRGGEIFYHPVEDRYLTPREYMRIHSYPDDYVLKGPIRGRSGSFKTLDQHRQIGNSVPPLLAQKVGASIVEVLDACDI